MHFFGLRPTHAAILLVALILSGGNPHTDMNEVAVCSHFPAEETRTGGNATDPTLPLTGHRSHFSVWYVVYIWEKRKKIFPETVLQP